jgi:hypothetical protein
MYSDDKYQYFWIGDPDTVMMWLQEDDEFAWGEPRHRVNGLNCQWLKTSSLSPPAIIGRPFSDCRNGCVVRRPLPIHQFSHIKKPNRYQILKGL